MQSSFEIPIFSYRMVSTVSIVRSLHFNKTQIETINSLYRREYA